MDFIEEYTINSLLCDDFIKYFNNNTEYKTQGTLAGGKIDKSIKDSIDVVFYNNSNDTNVIRMVSDALPKLDFGDLVDPNKNTKQIKDGKNEGENSFYHLQEKSDAKYMFLISCKDIKEGQEITANYNLYTYPKTGVGLQMI